MNGASCSAATQLLADSAAPQPDLGTQGSIAAKPSATMPAVWSLGRGEQLLRLMRTGGSAG